MPDAKMCTGGVCSTQDERMPQLVLIGMKDEQGIIAKVLAWQPAI
jgi:hypothetical protein